MLELQVKERDTKKKPAALRSVGVLPAVFYGPKEETTPVELNAKDFEKVWKETGGSAIVVLKGVGDDKEALIHEVDVHPVHGNPQHADLYVIERGKKLTVNVPLEFIGEAPAERAGHTIVKVMHEIEIQVRPAELPQNFEIDVSKMSEIGDHISVKDIKLPESGEFVTDPEETIISVKETIEVVEPVVEEISEEGEEEPTEGAEAEEPTGDEAPPESGEKKEEE